MTTSPEAYQSCVQPSASAQKPEKPVLQALELEPKPQQEETHYVLHPRRRSITRNVLPPRPRPRIHPTPPRGLAALVRPRARPRPRTGRHVFRPEEGPRRPGLGPVHDRVRPIDR